MAILQAARIAFAPEGVHIPDPTREHRPPPGAAGEKLLRFFQAEMKGARDKPVGQRAFQWTAPRRVGESSLGLRFTWQGKAAGLLTLARISADRKASEVQAVVALLTKTDPAEEQRLLKRLREHASLKTIPAAAFDQVGDATVPTVATFYAGEKATADGALHDVSALATRAFLDLFAVAGIDKGHAAGAKAMFFQPEAGDANRIPVGEPLSPELVDAMFNLFRQSLAELPAGFEVPMKFGDEPADETTCRYKRFGETAGLVIWTWECDGHTNIHALTALLTKRDAAADKQVMDLVRKYKVLGGLAPEAFDLPLNEPGPRTATFYADAGSALWNPLSTAIRTFSSAFFDQFGIAFAAGKPASSTSAARD